VSTKLSVHRKHTYKLQMEKNKSNQNIGRIYK